jgi:hypothetical protein
MTLNPIGTCFICARRHDNIGFRISQHYPVKWNCYACTDHMERAIRLPKKTFDIYETDALLAGGAVAGQYLDSIGQTDLAELDEPQFILFFAKFIGGYEDSMRKAFEGVV